MTTDILHEIWLPVAGYEGAYEVSNFGNVRSLDKTVRGRTESERFLKGRILKSKPSGAGYRSVNLSVNNLISTKLIHGLVAQAFIGDRPDGFEVNHIDGDKTNNHVKNLEYCSPSENMKHAFNNNLRVAVKGSKAGQSKLIEADIPVIRERVAKGEPLETIAKDYGVHNTTIWGIYHGKTWSHISSPKHIRNNKLKGYSRGSNRKCAKFTEADIPVIRQRLASGETGASIAKSYKVKPSVISNIKNGKTWNHVT